MKVIVKQCIGCGKSFEFDTTCYRATIIEAECISSTLLYLPSCPYCGRRNEVAVSIDQEV